MKVIERSPVGREDGPAGLDDRIRGVWQYGLSWDQDIQAQQLLIEHLASVFDNSYTAISNVAVPEFSYPVPLVIVGPIGIRIFYISAGKGIYKFREEKWYLLDEKSGHYRLSRPNIIRRTELLSRATFEYLRENGLFLEETEPVVFFSQAGIHVDADDPPVRLLLVDGVNRYLAKVLEEKPILEAREIQRIIELLTTSQPAKPEKEERIRSLVPEQDVVGVGEFRMKPWQWVVVFLLAIFMLISIIITIYIVRNLG
jgi:hypothetical protein